MEGHAMYDRVEVGNKSIHITVRLRKILFPVSGSR